MLTPIKKYGVLKKTKYEAGHELDFVQNRQ